MTKGNLSTAFSIIVIFLLLAVFVASSQAIAATPNAKTWKRSDYKMDCGDGRRGSNCTNYKGLSFIYSTPVNREDGSALARREIAYYIVQFEKDAGPTIQFEVPNTENFVLPMLPSGSYTFRISTVDISGTQGAFTADLQQIIP